MYEMEFKNNQAAWLSLKKQIIQLVVWISELPLYS